MLSLSEARLQFEPSRFQPVHQWIRVWTCEKQNGNSIGEQTHWSTDVCWWHRIDVFKWGGAEKTSETSGGILWSLETNGKVCAFGKKPRSLPPFSFKSNDLEMVQAYKYLGVWMILYMYMRFQSGLGSQHLTLPPIWARCMCREIVTARLLVLSGAVSWHWFEICG